MGYKYNPFTGALDDTGSSEVLSTTVTLTAAQLADLHNTPVELVPAPGAGKVLAPLAIATAGSAALDCSAYPIMWSFSTSVGTVVPDNNLTQAFTTNQTLSCLPTYAGVDSPMTTQVDGALPIPGAIAASERNTGGTGWAEGDTFAVGDAAGVVDTALSLGGIVSVGEWSERGAEWVNGDTFKVVQGGNETCQGTLVEHYNGGMDSCIFTNPGAGYSIGPADFVALTGVGTTATGVLIVGDRDGAVLTYHFTDPGTNNVLGTAVPATDASGSGADLTIDITALDYTDSPLTLKVKTLYTTMEV